MLDRAPLALLALFVSSLAAQAPLRVMPLGDSITEGTHGDVTYRYYLWQRMALAGCPIDLVGSRRGVWNGMPRFAAFDQDHESYWGKRVDELLGQARAWAAAAQPDVVLLHLGTNDLLQGQPVAATVNELGSMIDELRLGRPGVSILLAQVIPVIDWRGVAVEPLNAAVPGLAAAKSTPASPVVVVDHYTGFDPYVHTYDGIHPNQQGEQRMADAWLQALAAWLVPRRAIADAYGAGCAGTRGATPWLVPANLPRPGAVFGVVASRLDPTGGVAVGILGTSRTRWLGQALPMPLGAVGMAGCSLLASPDVVLPLPKAAGSAAWALRIPSSSGLLGVEVYFQVLDPRAAANPAGWVLSNGVRARVGVK